MSNESTKTPATTDHLDKFWNSFADCYELLASTATLNTGMNFINLLQIPFAKNILEVGCGDGSLLTEIIAQKSENTHITTFDLTENMCSKTQMKLNHLETNHGSILNALNEIRTSTKPSIYMDKATQYPNNIIEQQYKGIAYFPKLKTTLLQGNAEKLDNFKDLTYDVVYSNFVLHLVNDPKCMLKEVYRVLESNGRCAFSVWGSKEGSEWFTLFNAVLEEMDVLPVELKTKRNDGRSPFHLNDRNKVLDMMEEVGFKGCKA